MLLVSILLAWLGTEIRYAGIQRQAAAAVRESEGGVVYDYQRADVIVTPRDPPTPHWLRQLFGDDFLTRVVEVNLGDTSTDVMQKVGRVHSLESVSCSELTDDGVVPLVGLNCLSSLDLYYITNLRDC
jgi:hypothetical protein